MYRGLFCNTARASCSIFASGLMVYDALRGTPGTELEYIELNSERRSLSTDFDFYIFNYHPATSMAWLDTTSVRRLPGLKATIVLEVSPQDPFPFVSPVDFDAYLALDPTLTERLPRVYAFPRPLEDPPTRQPLSVSLADPIIGSFGFATIDKAFDKLVTAAASEFDRATVRLNIPFGEYAGSDQRTMTSDIVAACERANAGKLRLEITHTFLEQREVVAWCAANTLNCFFYERAIPGLAAVTDQAISSGRPLAISASDTFRHIHQFVPPYPLRSLRESIALSAPEVSAMKAAWSKSRFATKFSTVLLDHAASLGVGRRRGQVTLSEKRKGTASSIVGALRRLRLGDVLPPVAVCAWRRAAGLTALPNPVLQPYSSPLLKSFSRHGEDLLLDLLLGRRASGFYVDVGANDPSLNNNTKRFYDRGWRGLNIEPNTTAFRALVQARPGDINMNIGIAELASEVTSFTLSNDNSLTTLDREQSQRTAARRVLPLAEQPVEALPLRQVLHGAGVRTIDFMSVDAEGLDLPVLRSNDWTRFRPTILVVKINISRNAIVTFLNKQGYGLMMNNLYNGIFVDLRTQDPSVLALF